MIKIKTLYKINYNDIREITKEINEGCEWVFECGIPTRKYDGTACMVKDNILYKRYDAKINKKTGKRRVIPENAIPCIPLPDPKTGHFPHWILVNFKDPSNHLYKEAWDNLQTKLVDGTYELCGPKINGNKDAFKEHVFIHHGVDILEIQDMSFKGIREYLENHYMEGIVFHHPTDGKMCKIRRKDFSIKW